MFIPIILGTAREGRQSEKVAKLILSELEQRENIETQLIDPKDFIVPHTVAPWMNKPETKKWQEIAARADGFIVVAPEYNRGYSGELKLLIDQAEKEYNKKAVSIVGVSSGMFGGARVIQQLVQIFAYFKMYVLPDGLSVSKVAEVFNEDGTLKDESYRERVKKMVDATVDSTRDMKIVREKRAD